jgi:hypothetical protein
MNLETVHGIPVLVCAAGGAALGTERDALDLIGETAAHGARWVAVPAERLDPDFFRLRTRVAGDFVQKFAAYGVGCAVLGDISRYTRDSAALRDFVRESNRGRQLWFLAGIEELRERLGGGARPADAAGR